VSWRENWDILFAASRRVNKFTLTEMEVLVMKKKGFYIGLVTVFLFGFLSVPGTAVAAPAQNCSYIGSWYGFIGGVVEWTVNVQGLSQSSGTIDLEDIIFDPTLGLEMFEDAVRMSSIKGVWERTGGNTFSITGIGYAIDPTGAQVWLGKMSGYVTIVDDCNTESLDLTLEVFAPGQDPFAEAAIYGGFPLPVHEGYRMRVDPPYQP
jgi:hypothetical protein